MKLDGKIYIYANKKKLEKEGIWKAYIGQTFKTLESRAGSNGQGYHKYNPNIKSKFVNAIRKWGWDSFEGKVLVDNVQTIEELNRLERLFIAMYETYENGYNSTMGGDGVLGCKHTGMYGKTFTEEHRRKLSLAHKGQIPAMKGRKHTEETRAKIRERRKLQVGENHPMYGKSHKEETILKMSKPIRCIELDKEFISINKAVEYLRSKNIECSRPNLSKTLKGERKSCGQIIENGEVIKLHWEYLKQFTPTTTERKEVVNDNHATV